MPSWRNSIFKISDYPPAIKRQKSYLCVQVLCLNPPRDDMQNQESGSLPPSLSPVFIVTGGLSFIINDYLFSSYFLRVPAGHRLPRK